MTTTAIISDASRDAFVPSLTNYSSQNTSLDDDELSKVKFKDDGHSVEEEHKKDFYHIIHSSTLLLFQQNSYSYIMCCLEREDTSESSILFLYLLSGLHLKQLLTLTNHSHHECYFSLLLDSDTSILSRLIFFVSSEKLAKTTINTM